MAIGYKLRNYEGLRFFFDPAKGGYEVDGLDREGIGEELVIPGIVDEEPVISIGTAAFAGDGRIKSVTVPASVLFIGERAFQRTKVESIKFEEASWLENIMDNAFSYTSQLLNIEIPANVVSIRFNAFLHSSLESITFESGSKLSLIDGAFAGTRNIKSIDLPPGVVSIGSGAFWNSNITGMVIPETVRYIKKEAFGTAINIASLSIPTSVKSVGASAFHGWTSLQTIYVPFHSIDEADTVWIDGSDKKGEWREGSRALIMSSLVNGQLWPNGES